MAKVQVRYIVNDIDSALAFYCTKLGFREVMHPNAFFAMLERGDLRLVLSKPGGGAGGGQAMPDGRTPEPGGWNRFAIEVSDIEGLYDNLKKAGVHFRNEIINGVGGRQCICDDPAGNPIELFQPVIPEAKLTK